MKKWQRPERMKVRWTAKGDVAVGIVSGLVAAGVVVWIEIWLRWIK